MGNLLCRVDGEGNETTYAYDELDRVVMETVRYAKNGLAAEEKTYAYAPMGQVAQTKDATGDTTLTYTNAHRLETVRDPLGNLTAYTYDSRGNQTGVAYPTGKQVTYAYGGENRLMLLTDQDGGRTGYAYDFDGRLARTEHPDGAATAYTTDVTNAWDNYLGKNTTNINPITGAADPDRIFSADGTKSIRFGNHEMREMGTSKGHFHYETWTYDAVTDTMTVTNTLQRIIP
jgi:YD repeat-containing protein